MEPQIDLSKAKPMIPTFDKKKDLGFLVIFLIIFSFIVIGLMYFFLQKTNNLIISPVKNSENKIIPSSALIVTQKSNRKEVIGFLPSWIIAKKSEINLKGLTQLIYFGLSVNGNGEIVKYNDKKNEVLEWTYFNSDDFNQLKKQAKVNKTKLLIAIKNFDNKSIDELISNETAIKTLTKNLNKLIKEYELDGINIDFEYFTDTNFPTFKYLNVFLQTLAKDLKQEKQNLIISFDANAVNVIVDRAYDMAKIGEIMDQIILMGYDYHRAESTKAGPVAPILALENEHSITQSLNSLSGRVPKEKLILAIPFYGYEWQTISDEYKSPTIQTTGALASYQRVRELIENREDIKIYWDELAMSSWLVYNQSGAIKQIYYEDEKSIAKKVDLIIERELAGLAVWALGYEGNYQDLWQVIEKLK